MTLLAVPARSGGLAATGHRLTQLDPRLGFTVGPAVAAGWHALDQLGASTLSTWIDQKVARIGGHRGIATGVIAEGLARRLIGPATASWAVEGRLPDLLARNIAIRRTAEGMLDRTALRTGRFAVPVSDPAAVDPQACPLPHSRDLRSWFATGLLRTLGPLFDEVRAAGPFGRRGLWGLAADSAAGTLVRLVRQSHITPQAGSLMWGELDAAFQMLLRLGAPARIRPRITLDQVGGTETLVAVRGVCCLYCATPAGVRQPAPDRYCTSCPRLGDADRSVRVAAAVAAGGP